MYGVISSTTRKIKKLYGAIGATTKNIKKVYGVLGGVTKLIFSSEITIEEYLENIEYIKTGIMLLYSSTDGSSYRYCFDRTSTGISNWTNAGVTSYSYYASYNGLYCLNFATAANSTPVLYKYNTSTSKYSSIWSGTKGSIYSEICALSTYTSFASIYVSDKKISVDGSKVIFLVRGYNSGSNCGLGIVEYSISDNGILFSKDYGLLYQNSSVYNMSAPDCSMYCSGDLKVINLKCGISSSGSTSSACHNGIYRLSGDKYNLLYDHATTYKSGTSSPSFYLTIDGKYFFTRKGSSYTDVIYYIGENSVTEIGDWGGGSTPICKVFHYNPMTQVVALYPYNSYTSTGDVEYYYQLSETGVTSLGYSNISFDSDYGYNLIDTTYDNLYGLLIEFDTDSYTSLYNYVSLSCNSVGVITSATLIGYNSFESTNSTFPYTTDFYNQTHFLNP